MNTCKLCRTFAELQNDSKIKGNMFLMNSHVREFKIKTERDLASVVQRAKFEFHLKELPPDEYSKRNFVHLQSSQRRFPKDFCANISAGISFNYLGVRRNVIVLIKIGFTGTMDGQFRRFHENIIRLFEMDYILYMQEMLKISSKKFQVFRVSRTKKSETRFFSNLIKKMIRNFSIVEAE